VDEVKPFDIPKREVWAAFRKVKANRGAAGVDGQSIADFEADLSNNLYELWNRLSSGSYFPPPVRRRQEPWWFPPNERLESPSLPEWMKF
jgi:RNA-directed DNA polymerase